MVLDVGLSAMHACDASLHIAIATSRECSMDHSAARRAAVLSCNVCVRCIREKTLEGKKVAVSVSGVEERSGGYGWKRSSNCRRNER